MYLCAIIFYMIYNVAEMTHRIPPGAETTVADFNSEADFRIRQTDTDLCTLFDSFAYVFIFWREKTS